VSAPAKSGELADTGGQGMSRCQRVRPCEVRVREKDRPVDSEGQGLPEGFLRLRRAHRQDHDRPALLLLKVHGKLDGPLGPVPVDLEGIARPLEDRLPGDLFDADDPGRFHGLLVSCRFLAITMRCISEVPS